MISKKSSALIFDPKFFCKKYINRPESYFSIEKKHEIFGGVAHVSHIALKTYFHMTTCGFPFFARSEGQRDVIFHEKKYSQNSASLGQKIICLIFNN